MTIDKGTRVMILFYDDTDMVLLTTFLLKAIIHKQQL